MDTQKARRSWSEMVAVYTVTVIGIVLYIIALSGTFGPVITKAAWLILAFVTLVVVFGKKA